MSDKQSRAGGRPPRYVGASDNPYDAGDALDAYAPDEADVVDFRSGRTVRVPSGREGVAPGRRPAARGTADPYAAGPVYPDRYQVPSPEGAPDPLDVPVPSRESYREADAYEREFESDYARDFPEDAGRADAAAPAGGGAGPAGAAGRGQAAPAANLGGGARISRRGALERAADRVAHGAPRQYRPVSSYDEVGARERGRRGRRAGGAAPRHRGLVALVCVVAAVVALYVAVFGPIDRELAFGDAEQQALSRETGWHVPGAPYYVLALGSDAREGDTYSRSDTMILIRIDPISSKLTLVSIPRDTKVEIEGHGTQKINAAYAFDGPAGAVRAVSKLTGVSVSHVGVVYFDGISGLVDALGGVTVDVPVDVNDPDYTGLVMPAGTYEMDGETALLFSRVRHGFADGDFQRQADQRILIQAILDKVLSSGPAGVMALSRQVGSLASTDMRCYGLIPLMLRFTLTKPTVYSCSIPSTTATIGGVSYVIADEEGLRATMAKVDAGADPNAAAPGVG
ncbi:LCP family protein [Olsenella sp. YH-ols2223]|uniref:LCP family protein n=1 Tax=Olsenella absiana TaxID=3115222 RepID=A0ABU7R7D8_9ACTN